MRIVQLSDCHLSRDKPARAAELEACIRAINALQPKPDVVVHTGDIAHDGHIEDYEIAKGLLDQLEAPYFALPGNRDNRANLIKVFADGRHLRPDATFVQYAVDEFDIRMIMLDTMTETSNKGHLCKARLKDAEEMILADLSRPAVVFLHHPPFRVDVGPEPHNFETWSEAEALMEVFQRHGNLRGIYCGHVHRSFETAMGETPMIVTSSIASDLRWDKSNGPDYELPIFKLHSIDAAP